MHYFRPLQLMFYPLQNNKPYHKGEIHFTHSKEQCWGMAGLTLGSVSLWYGFLEKLILLFISGLLLIGTVFLQNGLGVIR